MIRALCRTLAVLLGAFILMLGVVLLVTGVGEIGPWSSWVRTPWDTVAEGKLSMGLLGWIIIIVLGAVACLVGVGMVRLGHGSTREKTVNEPTEVNALLVISDTVAKPDQSRSQSAT